MVNHICTLGYFTSPIQVAPSPVGYIVLCVLSPIQLDALVLVSGASLPPTKTTQSQEHFSFTNLTIKLIRNAKSPPGYLFERADKYSGCNICGTTTSSAQVGKIVKGYKFMVSAML